MYHGTVKKFIASNRQMGLQNLSFQHVHLSNVIETAEKVDSRRGKPIMLNIATGEMFRDGHVFYPSKKGVWLCTKVSAKYIKF